MKYRWMWVLLCMSASALQAQDFAGTWKGALEVQGMSLDLFFTITESAEGDSAYLSVPMQKLKDLPMDAIEVSGDSLRLMKMAMGMSYRGHLTPEGDSIHGTFTQGTFSTALHLERQSGAFAGYARPQEPSPDNRPYSEEEVTFANTTDSVTLAGTLTLPLDVERPPVVVLVSGSGPQNRDEELMGHKPFLVLADYLTRQGIAVLRYDDRGVDESTGEFQGATSEDFARDASAAVDFLASRTDLNTKQIGIIGHSEGGLIAPMVANANEQLAFIVMMAGPGIPGDEILLLQNKLISEANGMDPETLAATEEINRNVFAIATTEEDTEVMEQKIQAYVEATIPQYQHLEAFAEVNAEDETRQIMNRVGSPWFQFFLRYDPATELSQVTCPVLSLIGTSDLQVPAQVNSEAIEELLEEADNPDYTVMQLEGLNHLFQESETGSPAEYIRITQTISPVALELMSTWILERTAP